MAALREQVREAEERAAAMEARAIAAEAKVQTLSILPAKLEMQAQEIAGCRALIEQQHKAFAIEQAKGREYLVLMPEEDEAERRRRIRREETIRREERLALGGEVGEDGKIVRPWGESEATRIVERVLAKGPLPGRLHVCQAKMSFAARLCGASFF